MNFVTLCLRVRIATVVTWSRYPNAIMKLSSIPTNRSYPHRDIAPIVKRLSESYGADRMIYGGGFNADATGESYRAAFDRAESFLGHLTEPDRAKILGGTAVRLFGFAV